VVVPPARLTRPEMAVAIEEFPIVTMVKNVDMQNVITPKMRYADLPPPRLRPERFWRSNIFRPRKHIGPALEAKSQEPIEPWDYLTTKKRLALENVR